MLGEKMKDNVMAGDHGAILPKESSLVSIVSEVAKRIAKENGLSTEFECLVVANAEPNAFMMPGEPSLLIMM